MSSKLSTGHKAGDGAILSLMRDCWIMRAKFYHGPVAGMLMGKVQS